MRPLLSVTVLLVAACLLLFAASTAATNPTAHNSGWTNSQLAFSQTDTYADGDYGGTVQYTAFGFSIPAGTINGVLVETDAYRTGTRNNSLDPNLLNVGTCTGKTGAALSTDTDTYEQFGGAADTWACTDLTVGNVNSSAFGVNITGGKAGGPNPNAGTYHLDHVRVTVTYTAGGGGGRKRAIVMAGGFTDGLPILGE